MATKKRIRIPYNGRIAAKLGVFGPVTTPYYEDINVIQTMLGARIPIIEVIDGREIKLTLANYKEDFNKVVRQPVYIKVPVPSDLVEKVEPVVTPGVTEVPIAARQDNRNVEKIQATADPIEEK